MMTAKEAKTKLKTKETAERIAQEAEWAKEKRQRNAARRKAMKETYPSVMKAIEKEINEAIKKKQHYAYFRFDDWMRPELIAYNIQEKLNELGYDAELDSSTPIAGADPDSGEGGTVCGPTRYWINIDFKEDEDTWQEKVKETFKTPVRRTPRK